MAVHHTANFCILRSLAQWLILLGFLLLPSRSEAQPLTGEVLVTDYLRDQVVRYDAATGAFLGLLITVPTPGDAELGPDGFLYLQAETFQFGPPTQVWRVDLATRSHTVLLNNAPTGRLEFAPNGNLLIAGQTSNSIFEFDRVTGALVRTFGHGIRLPHAVDFGPDGNYYVARGHHQFGDFTSSVVKVDGVTGNVVGTFITSPVNTPQDIQFGPNGDLYLLNQLNAPAVVRFDGRTGALKQLVEPQNNFLNPQTMEFLPDGDLLVSMATPGVVYRYDGVTGMREGIFDDENVREPVGLVYVPEPAAFWLAIAAALILFAISVLQVRRGYAAV